MKVIKSDYLRRTCSFFVLLVLTQLVLLSESRFVKPYMLLETWRKTDGLPANFINSILQTKDGLLWFICGNSLVSYDGEHFDIFTPDQKIIEGNVFIAFSQDEQGRIIIQTTKGILVFHRYKKSFNILQDIQNLPQNNLAVDKISSLQFHGDLNKKDISVVLADKKDNLWVGTYAKGLWVVQDGVFKKQEHTFFDNNFIHCLFRDNNGNIWVGTDKGLCQIIEPLTQNSRFVYHLPGSNSLSGSKINAIVQDSQGTIFVGTDKSLERFYGESDEQSRSEQILQNMYIMSLFIDREDNLWIGTRESGLKCLHRTNFTTFSVEEDSPENNFRNILIDSRGTVWAGTRHGRLYTFEDGRFYEFPLRQDIFDKTLFTMTEDSDGSLLLGTEYQGLFRLKDGRISPFMTESGPVEGTIVGIFRDSQKRLWICRYGQEMGYYENGRFHQVFSQEDFPGKVIFRFYEDSRQNLWLSSIGGLICFENGEPDKSKMKRYLNNINVSSIYEDREGFLWLGSYEDGLIRFDTKTLQAVIFTQEQGLMTDKIYSVQEDSQGFFWMATGEGIQRVKRMDLDSFVKGEMKSIPCVLFGASDGLNSIECSIEHENLIAENLKGEFFFATKNGIAVTRPEKISLNKIPPSVLIDKVLIDGKAELFSSDDNIIFNINSRQKLDITFKAVTFTGAENIKYGYTLQGKKQKWDSVEPPQDNSVSFSKLTPGLYTFHVTAGNAHGVWNEEGSVLKFQVVPLFFQSLLFKIGVVVLFLGGCLLVFMFVQKRKTARKNKYKKTRLAEDIAGEYEKKLLHFLEEERIYRDNMLSVQLLAEKLSIPPHHLSQIINDKFQKNFYELINSYRIEEAIEKLQDEKDSQEKILAIAYDVGFNTLGSFNRAFKRHTGKAPSEFRNSKTKPIYH
jgi:ligand-binding sensor domain-containing protein/AraC-like DNA-binding protein